MTEEKEIVAKEKNVLMSADELKKQIEQEKEVRKVITDYIKSELKDGIDFGTITIKSRDGSREYTSKPTLFKPGAEKISSIMHLRATFTKDNDTWEMSGKVPGLFCYICHLINTKGEIVGEGRGAANVKEKAGWIENNAIKIAQKRAMVDSVIRTGQLSDVFTQDIEDMPSISSGGSDNPPSEAQKKFITDLFMKKMGLSENTAKIKTEKIQTSKEARIMIDELLKKPNQPQMDKNEEDFSNSMIDDEIQEVLNKPL